MKGSVYVAKKTISKLAARFGSYSMSVAIILSMVAAPAIAALAAKNSVNSPKVLLLMVPISG
ncbi:MAG TPA: hypothetical protein ENI11_00970 [Actinobacteria bacterium]|nr:hypothetical protein [Actinomycetota bacterium]